MNPVASRFPAIFVNHGGGPLPLLGRQPGIVNELQKVRSEFFLTTSNKPKGIVVISAHWESDPIQITSSPTPSMYYDYSGFPPESYQYKYDAPGSPTLANKIHDLLSSKGIKSELNSKRGYDHGVFVPLMIVYPEADIPVVSISLHKSLAPDIHIQLGKALETLRNKDDDGILILGSGFTFHNMQSFFHPSPRTYDASSKFNEWLKETLLSNNSNVDSSNSNYDTMIEKLRAWERIAPCARQCHPREEHFIPLLVIAGAAGTNGKARLLADADASDVTSQHATSSYIFE